MDQKIWLKKQIQSNQLKKKKFKFKKKQLMSNYLTEEILEKMPKRALNGYMLFREDKIEEVKAKNQDKSMTEQSSLIGEMWREMNEKQKEVSNQLNTIIKPYNKEAADLKAKYLKDYDAWIKQFKLDKDKVRDALKQLKEDKKRKKKGSNDNQKQKKGKGDSDEEDEEEEEQKQKKEKKVNNKEKPEKEKQVKKETQKKDEKTSKQQQKQGGRKKC